MLNRIVSLFSSKPTAANDSPKLRKWLSELSVVPNDVSVYLNATTNVPVKSVHPSSTDHLVTGNSSRLEFLGDSVLGVVAAGALFHRYPLFRAGHLSTLQTRLVNNKYLDDVGFRIGIEDVLSPRPPWERARGQKDKSPVFPAGVRANAVEGVIGAIYLDLGMSEAEKFVKTHVIKKGLEEMPTDLDLGVDRHPLAVSRDDSEDDDVEKKPLVGVPNEAITLLNTYMKHAARSSYEVRLIDRAENSVYTVYTVGIYENGELVSTGQAVRYMHAMKIASWAALETYAADDVRKKSIAYAKCMHNASLRLCETQVVQALTRAVRDAPDQKIQIEKSGGPLEVLRQACDADLVSLGALTTLLACNLTGQEFWFEQLTMRHSDHVAYALGTKTLSATFVVKHDVFTKRNRLSRELAQFDDRCVVLRNVPQSYGHHDLVRVVLNNGKDVLNYQFVPPRHERTPKENRRLVVVLFGRVERAAECMERISASPGVVLDAEACPDPLECLPFAKLDELVKDQQRPRTSTSSRGSARRRRHNAAKKS